MKTHSNQHGFSLLLLVFSIAIIITGYVVKSLNSFEMAIQRDKNTALALAEAKAALIGWSVAHPQYPGIFPFPDRSGDSNYDGNSDCSSAVVPAFELLIGKLPYASQSAPCVGVSASQYGISSGLIDGYGERLWYAVSKNLIRTSTGLGALTVNPSTAAIPNGWLVVRDKNGQVISNRVAAVIISPGAPVGLQNRLGGLAGPAEYLDSITIANITYSNANYAVENEDFIMAEDMRNVSPSDILYKQPYLFNDKLIYITIDELMGALNKRAVREAVNSFKAYYLSSSINPNNRFYPYAAALGDVQKGCDDKSLDGTIPVSNMTSNCPYPNNGLDLPEWFTESHWQDFIQYNLINDCSYAQLNCISDSVSINLKSNNYEISVLAP